MIINRNIKSRRNHVLVACCNDFFSIVRKKHEYGTTLTVWNRNLYFWGITPRLTFSWDKTKSNHFYYDNHNMDVYLEFSKSF